MFNSRQHAAAYKRGDREYSRSRAPASASGVITRGTGPSRGCTWKCAQATTCTIPPSRPRPRPCRRGFHAHTAALVNFTGSGYKAAGSAGESVTCEGEGVTCVGGVTCQRGREKKHMFRGSAECLQIQRQCVHILNCGLFRVNKESTQQRMLLSSLKRQLMPPTARKPALQPTPASHPVRSLVGERKLEFMYRMENGQSTLRMNFFPDQLLKNDFE